MYVHWISHLRSFLLHVNVSILYFDFPYDFIFACSSEFNQGMVIMYFHHLNGILGGLLGNALNDFMGSIQQLTFVTEMSTFNVNFRQLLYWHKLSSSSIYVYNGLLMTFGFFVWRILWYPYIILYAVKANSPQSEY